MKLGFDLLMQLPAGLGYAVLGVLVLGYVSGAGFILARLGYKPLWALLLCIPFVQVAAWYLLIGQKMWPRERDTFNN